VPRSCDRETTLHAACAVRRYVLTSPAAVVIAERFARRAFWEEAARAGCWDGGTDEVSPGLVIGSPLMQFFTQTPCCAGAPSAVCCVMVVAYCMFADVRTHATAQVDVDYSDADKRAVLRFFTALAELISRQPPARPASGSNTPYLRHQVSPGACCPCPVALKNVLRIPSIRM